MSVEGVLPRAAGIVAKKTGAPWIAILTVLAAALLFLALGSVGRVANITSFGSLITFALVNLAMLHLRRVAPTRDRPFKSPVSIGWLSITGLLGLLSCLGLMTRFDSTTVILGSILPGSGALLYWLYGSRQTLTDTTHLHEPHEPGS
jgi:APA family basic amino acid/polyamine antiporter